MKKKKINIKLCDNPRLQARDFNKIQNKRGFNYLTKTNKQKFIIHNS